MLVGETMLTLGNIEMAMKVLARHKSRLSMVAFDVNDNIIFVLYHEFIILDHVKIE